MIKETNNRTDAIVQTLPPPTPPDKHTTTIVKLINSKHYTQESLITHIEEQIVKGRTYRSICKELSIHPVDLSKWLAKDINYPRMRVAVKMSADYYADMSIQVLKNAPSDKIELLRAKELSSAYRWMARVRDTAKYGEKLDVTSEGQQIVQLSLGAGIKPPDTAEEVQYIDVTNDNNDTDRGE